jgi:hypothetical protein
MRLLATLLLSLAPFVTTGCAWSGYVKGLQHEVFTAPANSEPLMTVEGYLVQPNSADRQRLREAIQETLLVLTDPRFAAAVRGYDGWIPHVGAESTMTGDSVLDSILTHEYRNVQFLVNSPVNAIAVTNLGEHHHGIVIRSSQVRKWSLFAEARAELINTIAHEMTHLVPDPDTPCTMAYTDDGHDSDTEKSLVSYRVGNIAECVFLAREGLEDQAQSCFDSLGVDGRGHER